jgi:ATP-dependent helicase/nuclease subunit B
MITASEERTSAPRSLASSTEERGGTTVEGVLTKSRFSLERQRQANVFTIPASAPFLGVLIDALCAGRLVPAFPASDNPLALAQATLFLPTRRACRKAREIFLDRLGRDAAILPRIVPLGDIDEDEIAFADIANPDALALPEALDPLERPLTLAQMVAAWANATTPERGAPLVANTPAAAIALADDLARLMDDMTTREVPWENLSKLVPDDLDKHWQLSLDFLKFVYPRWREFLAGRGVMEPAERRDRLIEAETRRLQNSNAPVIAAGSTGSMPSTAKLLAAIARLQQGAVVLPGLDLTLDEPSWQRIAGAEDDATHDGVPASGHPQFAMQALLTRIGITRSEVEPLARTPVREALVCEALRPAATTEHWRESRVQMAAQSPSALDGLGMIEAANAEQESLAIAVSIREVLEQPGKSVALVTPDRALARRVVAALARWDIAADDSGGVALAETSAGRLARLGVGRARGAERARSGDAARAVEASAHPTRCACRECVRAGARDLARASPEARHVRPRACAGDVPRDARRLASQRSAQMA